MRELAFSPHASSSTANIVIEIPPKHPKTSGMPNNTIMPTSRQMSGTYSPRFRPYMIECLPRGVLITSLIFAFVIIPFGILFTGIVFSVSEDEEISNLGKRMSIGSGSVLVAEILVFASSILSVACFYCGVRTFIRWQRNVSDV